MLSLKAEERKRYILEQVEKNGEVKVKELALDLGVSTESIRQYLNQMESENKIKKVYGGAIKTSYSHIEPSFYSRENINFAEKDRIGKAASQLIKPFDTIIIDEGSTTLQIVRHIINLEGLKIITNSVAVLSLLIDYKIRSMFKGEVIFLGGKIDAKNYRSSGVITEQFVENFYADHAFIATEGISMKHGVTSYSAERAILTRKFIQSAKKATAVIDHSKFDKRMYYKIADLSLLDNIVSDSKPPEEWDMSKRKVNWIVAPK